MKNSPVIEIQDLTFSYDIRPVFNGVNACIHRGDYLTVIGPNGGGKSTLGKLITGLLSPTSGSILVNGSTASNARGQIGYVPQYINFDTLFPITVKEAVLTGTMTSGWGFYSRRDKKTAEEMIALTGLEEVADNAFSQISGGQRQRALVARALASRPEILILDEPTSSVDARVEQQFRELLIELNKELTIILITHDFGFVDKETSRVFCINHNIVEHPADGVTDDLIASSYSRGVKPVVHTHTVKPHNHDAELNS